MHGNGYVEGWLGDRGTVCCGAQARIMHYAGFGCWHDEMVPHTERAGVQKTKARSRWKLGTGWAASDTGSFTPPGLCDADLPRLKWLDQRRKRGIGTLVGAQSAGGHSAGTAVARPGDRRLLLLVKTSQRPRAIHGIGRFVDAYGLSPRGSQSQRPAFLHVDALGAVPR
jgi:hypothetical protein